MAEEIAANSMASSMLVFEASFPEVLAGKDIHITTSDGAVRGPGKSLEVECAKKYARIGLSLEGCRLTAAKLSRTGDVGRTIKILATRVEQIDFTVVEAQCVVYLRRIVDDSTIGAN